MPRRFALALLIVLVLVLGALLGARALKLKAARSSSAVPTARPTPVVPPTPIPARRVALFFESAADEKLHPEARDVPVSTDAVALIRSIAAAVLEGPRRADLLRPFPDGWRLRGAYRLATGVAVLDLAAPSSAPEAVPAPGPRWNAGSHEEETAIQTLLVSLAKNVPDVTAAVLLVGGEPAETLGGHVDLTHPLHADLARAVDDPLGEPPPPPSPTPVLTPTPASTPTPEPTATKTPRPRRTRAVAERT
jgi:sporulation and spore germination protein